LILKKLTLESIGKLHYQDLHQNKPDDFKPSDVIDFDSYEDINLPSEPPVFAGYKQIKYINHPFD